MEPRRALGRAPADGPDRRRAPRADELWDLGGREAIAEHLRDLADAKLDARRRPRSARRTGRTVERLVLVRTIDSLWVEHLTELDDMRRGIGLRGYAQQDPLNEFRREAFRMYEELRGLIRHGVASTIFRVTVTRQPAARRRAVARCPRPAPRRPRAPRRRRRTAADPATAARRTAGTGRGPTPRAGSSAAVLRGAIPTGPAARNIRESLGDEALVSAAGAAARPRRRRGPARLHARPARGSGATTRAGADRAPSTRSATAADAADMRAPARGRRRSSSSGSLGSSSPS